MSKKYCLKRCFEKQYRKYAQELLKSTSKHLYRIHCSMARKISSKKLLLLKCQILGLLLDTLATDEKCPVFNRENLTIPIQMQLSQKQKTFSRFFAAFWKSRLHFKIFELKDDPHSFCIFEVTDCENVVRWMSKKSDLKGCFDKEYGKPA